MYSDFTEEKVTENEDMVIVLFQPSSRKSLRKDHDGIMNRSGVYLHLSTTEDGVRPSIYAGQARHLETRGAHSTRIKDKGLVILAARRAPRDMDENWRQELEHLLIKDLVDREESHNIVCDNKKMESASYCVEEEKGKIRTWFYSLLSELEDHGVPGYTKVGYSKHDVKLYSIKSSQRATKNHFKVEKARVAAGRVTVPKESLTTVNQDCVPISHQEVKTELIKSGILEPVEPEGEHFRFTEEYTFGSRSEATAVIINGNKGWKAAGWELDG